MNGILIFTSVAEAIRAGFEIVSPHGDAEGLLYARARTSSGWAVALIRPVRDPNRG